MFIHNINPTLLRIGFLEVRLYGIIYALGFLGLYFYLNKKKDKLKIEKNQIDNLILHLLIGLLVGARIFHFLFSEPSIFIKKPLELFMLWQGGMSFFGALLGCFIALIYYTKKINKD